MTDCLQNGDTNSEATHIEGADMNEECNNMGRGVHDLLKKGVCYPASINMPNEVAMATSFLKHCQAASPFLTPVVGLNGSGHPGVKTTLLGMASNLINGDGLQPITAMASNRKAMASNLHQKV